jgi:hypothetical protein
MATIRQRESGSWEVVIRRKGILKRVHYAAADTEADAVAYARRIERQLDQGIMPVELQESSPQSAETVLDWARLYLRQVHISESDRGLLNAMFDTLSSWPVSAINMQWAQSWVSSMKQRDKLAPSSIRHKVGAVARLLDWCLRNDWININPLRMLPVMPVTLHPMVKDASMLNVTGGCYRVSMSVFYGYWKVTFRQTAWYCVY